MYLIKKYYFNKCGNDSYNQLCFGWLNLSNYTVKMSWIVDMNSIRIAIDHIDWGSLTFGLGDKTYFILLKNHPMCGDVNIGHCIDASLKAWLLNICGIRINSKINKSSYIYSAPDVEYDESIMNDNDQIEWSWNHGIDKKKGNIWINYDEKSNKIIENGWM